MNFTTSKQGNKSKYLRVVSWLARWRQNQSYQCVFRSLQTNKILISPLFWTFVWWHIFGRILQTQYLSKSSKTCFFGPYLSRSSGSCTAQLFPRWCVVIRELLEAVTLGKCSTSVSFQNRVGTCAECFGAPRLFTRRTNCYKRLLVYLRVACVLNLCCSEKESEAALTLTADSWAQRRQWMHRQFCKWL